MKDTIKGLILILVLCAIWLGSLWYIQEVSFCMNRGKAQKVSPDDYLYVCWKQINSYKAEGGETK